MLLLQWAVNRLDTYPELSGLSNVVCAVHWTLTGTDGDVSGFVSGSADLPPPDASSFTAFDELTPEIVLGWVDDVLGDDQIAVLEANVARRIADQIAPLIATPPLPWGDAP